MSVTVPASGSTITVGSTTVNGSECARGISSSVRLAAWIAASRATVATSPFGASPAATRAAASGDIRTTARARAQRTVSAFADTSTIRARPPESRWVSVPSTGNHVSWVESAAVRADMKQVSSLDLATDLERLACAGASVQEILEAARLAITAVEERSHHDALHDALTGLPNRTLLEDRVSGALARLRRGSWRVALMCVDVDRLKVLNETLGHRAGDELLRAIGPRLADVIRPGDTLARFSGDGFSVLCEGIADEGHAVRIAERIRAAFDEPFEVDGASRFFTAS